MKGLLPEANRGILAARLAHIVTAQVKGVHGNDSPQMKHWLEQGKADFFDHCELTIRGGKPVPFGLDGTRLQEFCSLWKRVDHYVGADGESVEMSDEMHVTINTMVTHLEHLAETGQLPNLQSKEEVDAANASAPDTKPVVQQD